MAAEADKPAGNGGNGRVRLNKTTEIPVLVSWSVVAAMLAGIVMFTINFTGLRKDVEYLGSGMNDLATTVKDNVRALNALAGKLPDEFPPSDWEEKLNMRFALVDAENARLRAEIALLREEMKKK